MARERAGMKAPGGRKGRDPAATRANVVKAASSLFARKGLDGTSIREIADEAGESISAIYYYFDDKSDLYQTVVLELALGALTPVIEAEIDERGTPAKRLERLLQAYIRFFSDSPEIAMMFMHNLVRVFQEEELVLLPLLAERVKAIEKIVREGQASGELAKVDPGLYSFMFIGAIIIRFFDGLLHVNSGDNWPYGDYSEKQFTEFMMKTFLARVNK